MKCQICNLDKLSKEFPPENITEECQHPRKHCMRCLVAYVREYGKCPHPKCGQHVKGGNSMVDLLQHTLDEMFRVYDTTYTPLVVPEAAAMGVIQVTVLNGDSMTLGYDPYMTVGRLKGEIEEQLQHEVKKQKLLYNSIELHVRDASGVMMKLSDYNIGPNTVLHLVVLMFAIPESFDHVIFDLQWGYPRFGKRRIRKRDFLDASCLMFNNTRFVGHVDYKKTYHSSESVCHSGDIMEDWTKTGHHTIEVFLQKIPHYISHLFFTLSAYRATTIARYPRKRLRFFEASKPDVELCTTTFDHARHSEAIIMCSLSRTAEGWAVFQSGQLSSGNAEYYRPLKDTIIELIRQGY